MPSFNRVILMGNLIRGPELRYTPSGTAVATLGLAVNHRSGSDDKKKEVLFIDIVVWRKSAEACAKHLQKGAGVHIEGRLRLRQWEKEGQKHSKIEVTASSVQFLPRSASPGEQSSKAESAGGEQSPGEEFHVGDEPSADDEVPF